MPDDIDLKPRAKTVPKVARPPLFKVILVNDDYTPREFVVRVLKAEFRMTEDQAYPVMVTAHRRGACVVAVYAKDIAETKATRATDAGRSTSAANLRASACQWRCSSFNEKSMLFP